ncbi:AraC family transcriptional regulator [Rheinheimera riviphila]|uniref:AraC family transcriptional regulator n=1 Tax=Rheinheimera riviphila TaxID=1834037 RepID=A0A437R042_9GAMM|nr:AraC family transcriptional regulator [Rheinheimera riviphila]RVU40128.1 AraC family transcriptional regulator [Rheinheimera riviphila]
MIADRIPLFAPGLHRLAHLGLDVAQILHQAGISLLLHQPVKMTLTTSQYFALWAAIGKVSNDKLIGLRLGGEARPDQFDPASFAALHSDTFKDALTRLARYKRLTCPETIVVKSDDDSTRISFHWLWANDPAPCALTDAAFANIQLLLRCGTGKNMTPLRVELKHARSDMVRFAEYFGCEVLIDMEHDALVYTNERLEERFVTGNQDLVAALVPGLDLQLASASPPSFDEQVKNLLIRMMRGERPSIEAVARQLCLSPRTLQRRLTEAHTSYQSILDTVRCDTACQLLSHTKMEPGEIAFYLGFEEVNSFQRAFHKWQGITPTQWRMQTTSCR